jgi:hypothetical protein
MKAQPGRGTSEGVFWGTKLEYEMRPSANGKQRNAQLPHAGNAAAVGFPFVPAICMIDLVSGSIGR